MLKKLNHENFKVGSITMFMLKFPTRWVLTEKFVNGNKTTKARLIERGFEEDHLAKLRTDSPTCKRKFTDRDDYYYHHWKGDKFVGYKISISTSKGDFM